MQGACGAPSFSVAKIKHNRNHGNEFFAFFAMFVLNVVGRPIVPHASQYH